MIFRRVVNASPLIFLTRVRLLDVLHEPGVPVFVPDRVFNELGGIGPHDPAVSAVRKCLWLQIVPTPLIPASVQGWSLDAGESAVLALALENADTQVILDDLAARRCAKALGLPLQGTLGLILVAKHLGMIAAVRPVIETLRRSGMYVSDRLAEQVFEQAGE